jgi:hypothetical protein
LAGGLQPAQGTGEDLPGMMQAEIPGIWPSGLILMETLNVGRHTFRKFQPMGSIILFDYSRLGNYGPRVTGFSTAKTTRRDQKTPTFTFRYVIDFS